VSSRPVQLSFLTATGQCGSYGGGWCWRRWCWHWKCPSRAWRCVDVHQRRQQRRDACSRGSAAHISLQASRWAQLTRCAEVAVATKKTATTTTCGLSCAAPCGIGHAGARWHDWYHRRKHDGGWVDGRGRPGPCLGGGGGGGAMAVVEVFRRVAWLVRRPASSCLLSSCCLARLARRPQ